MMILIDQRAIIGDCSKLLRSVEVFSSLDRQNNIETIIRAICWKGSLGTNALMFSNFRIYLKIGFLSSLMFEQMRFNSAVRSVMNDAH